MEPGRFNSQEARLAHHHHHGEEGEGGDLRLTLAVIVNFTLTIAQLVGGILAGSLALVADALHNFSDAISLVIAFGARRIARRPPDGNMTFGYGRIEMVAALINYTTLILIGLYLAYEAVWRFIEPQRVEGWLVVAIAGFALVVDVATAMLTWSLSKSSANIRAAFLHNVADALGSVAVIVAGTLILLYDWRLVDPIATLLISGYILWQSAVEIGPVIRVLMLGSPPDIACGTIIERIGSVGGVAGVHHAHCWQMDEHRNALDAHIVIAEGFWGEGDAIKDRIRELLRREFAIAHTTLEIECSRHSCANAAVIGH